MTKEDIKKALEFCTELELPCEECPYDNVRNCSDTLKLDARKLIIAQKNEIEQLKAEKKQAQVDTINTIVEYCENPNHWNELKDCKLWGGKSDDLRDFFNRIFKEIENEN